MYEDEEGGYLVNFIKLQGDLEDYYTILSVCNGSYYGGGFNIAPKSNMTDGKLDIYYAEKMSKLKMLPLLLKVKKGKHEGKRRIHKFRTDHIEINLEEKPQLLESVTPKASFQSYNFLLRSIHCSTQPSL